MKRLCLIGAGGHGQVIADLVAARRRAGDALELVAVLDDDPRRVGTTLLGVPVVGPVEQLARHAHDAVVVGVGINAARAAIFERLAVAGERPLALVHPAATVAADVVLGEGTVVFAGAVINTGSVIGPNTIINTGATVDHHASLGAHVHVAPGVNLGGNVTLGDGVFVGIGSAIIPGRTVGPWTILGAGSVLVRDLPGHVKAFGVPARVVSRDDEGTRA